MAGRQGRVEVSARRRTVTADRRSDVGAFLQRGGSLSTRVATTTVFMSRNWTLSSLLNTEAWMSSAVCASADPEDVALDRPPHRDPHARKNPSASPHDYAKRRCLRSIIAAIDPSRVETKVLAVCVEHCGLTQGQAANALNAAGHRTPQGRPFRQATVSMLLRGRYDGESSAEWLVESVRFPDKESKSMSRRPLTWSCREPLTPYLAALTRWPRPRRGRPVVQMCTS